MIRAVTLRAISDGEHVTDPRQIAIFQGREPETWPHDLIDEWALVNHRLLAFPDDTCGPQEICVQVIEHDDVIAERLYVNRRAFVGA